MFKVFLLTIFFIFTLPIIKQVSAAGTEPAGATAGPGCDQSVADAHVAIANAKVASDVAATEQLMDKPESVLAMTCFEKGAKVSAKAGGSIFSGDFSKKLEQVLDKGLKIHYGNYSEGTASKKYNLASGGGLGGLYTSFMSAISINFTIGSSTAPSFNCDKMDQLWEASMSEGIAVDIPTLSFDDLVNGTLPANGVGDDFKKSFNAAFGSSSGNGNDLSNKLNNAISNMTPQNIPDLSGTKSVCDVLAAAGIGSC